MFGPGFEQIGAKIQCHCLKWHFFFLKNGWELLNVLNFACIVRFRMCSSKKKSIPTPLKVIRNSSGEGGVLKAKILEAKYEAKLEFLGGRGGHNKKPPMRGVWIFPGTTQSQVGRGAGAKFFFT